MYKLILTSIFITLVWAGYAQTKVFIEYAPTLTSGHVGNSLHYNNQGRQLGQGYSMGVGLVKPSKKYANFYNYWAFMRNIRVYELNRTQPYSQDPTAQMPLRREARGIELLWGMLYKKEINPMLSFWAGGGLTQNVVAKQYQSYISSNPQKTETFGVGSATFRNRFFMRAGAELKIIPALKIAIEPCFSGEIKALFVKTPDKVNPLTYGLNIRATYSSIH